MKKHADEAAAFLKLLAHPDRLMIVCTLCAGERSVRELEEGLGIRQPGLSQQIGELRKAGIITFRKEGRAVHYRLADARSELFVSVLHSLFCEGMEKAPPG
ncbi:winged helix-turn-helix transcriptional regulator [Phaeovibrio sulfidiphilus]|uniref:Winged helix-turn-helix transcriptional regulator n=1 Tax=Phaeovibrio sulfidiphilus TaxID=1220600 RepID=A0A8J6YKF4_9PROT|nr:metalloregulator ArsR/SmtB family transcription factor [Phaeovibrio sulfidiphilus]MBE1236175.1 winged helix-turn-helix transcriptional regulator [Phaeovibrio sulfidiphilus]